MEGNARIVYLSGDARAVIGLMSKGELFGLAPALDLCNIWGVQRGPRPFAPVLF